MLRLLRSPTPWLAAFLLWGGVLWWLSATTPDLPGGPEIPHFDKFAHFGYFLGGGGLLAGYLHRRNLRTPRWGMITLTTAAVLAAVGAIDEWHQTFTPGRQGNDFFDWVADVCGAFAGAWLYRKSPLTVVQDESR